MPAASSKDITLHLADIRDLFIAPALDPFARQEANFTGQSGLERVVRQLEESSIKHETIRLTVVLPPKKITLGNGPRVRQAIERYCDLKTEDNERQLKVLRRHGLGSLWRGLVFLGICTGLATLINSSLFDAWAPVIRGTLSEGLTVIGWVALWHPFEALVYDPEPLKQENEVYAFLRRLTVKVKRER